MSIEIIPAGMGRPYSTSDGNGLTRKYPLDRHYRDVLGARRRTIPSWPRPASRRSPLPDWMRQCLLDQSFLSELA